MRVSICRGGFVENVILLPDGCELTQQEASWPEGSYTAPPGATLAEGGNIGWPVVAGVPQAPTPSPPTMAELRDYATNKRWRVETGGTVVGGIPVPTDDRAKTMIGRAARTGSAVPTTPFIVAGVNYGVLTKSQFEALDAAIDVHIAETFVVLSTVLSGIAAGTITTTAQIDAADWPLNE